MQILVCIFLATKCRYVNLDSLCFHFCLKFYWFFIFLILGWTNYWKGQGWRWFLMSSPHGRYTTHYSFKIFIYMLSRERYGSNCLSRNRHMNNLWFYTKHDIIAYFLLNTYGKILHQSRRRGQSENKHPV